MQKDIVGGIYVKPLNVSGTWICWAYLAGANYTVKKTMRYVASKTRKPGTGEW